MHLLVLLPWGAAFLVFRSAFSDWRQAALAASVFWGVLVVGLTEGLSLFQVLSARPASRRLGADFRPVCSPSA